MLILTSLRGQITLRTDLWENVFALVKCLLCAFSFAFNVNPWMESFLKHAWSIPGICSAWERGVVWDSWHFQSLGHWIHSQWFALPFCVRISSWRGGEREKERDGTHGPVRALAHLWPRHPTVYWTEWYQHLYVPCEKSKHVLWKDCHLADFWDPASDWYCTSQLHLSGWLCDSTHTVCQKPGCGTPSPPALFMAKATPGELIQCSMSYFESWCVWGMRSLGVQWN